MERKVSTVSPHAEADQLPHIFERGEVALVVDDDRNVLVRTSDLVTSSRLVVMDRQELKKEDALSFHLSYSK